MPLRIVADLTFEVEVPGQEPVHGRLSGSGRALELEVDRPEVFAGRSDTGAVRGIAEALARRGLLVRVRHGGRHLVTIGAIRAPWWQRRATGSPYIRLGSLRALWSSGRRRWGRAAGPVLPDGGLVPPPTLFPVAPTLGRPPRRRVTTTHDPARGGRPRLVPVVQGNPLPAELRTVYWLSDEVTTIGSAAGATIRFPGLSERHAEVVHDEDDEYVVVAHHPETRVNGVRIERQFLRTGSRLEVGGVTLAYSREEYADHGRPHGGRIGGELGYQVPQPPRHRLQPTDPEERR